MRLLVVEDNSDLADLLTQGLQASGFSVDVVAEGEPARLAMAVRRYAAVVLDLGLPDEDGLEVLSSLRRRGDSTPILVLTARGGLDDRVAGLRAGADDYLLKPFALEELTARLEALLRRPGEMLGRTLSVGELSFDLPGRQAFVRGRPLTLSARELDTLEILMRRSGRVVLKQHLEDHLFGLRAEIGSNAVEVQVHRLRRRLEPLQAGVQIHTVRGVGYMLSEAG
ncbi:MAG: response regulator transcription factor [Hyphomicrobiales bacterium]|nr:response regulator transcription factor [Hyphomicrobiales bacterium]